MRKESLFFTLIDSIYWSFGEEKTTPTFVCCITAASDNGLKFRYFFSDDDARKEAKLGTK